MSSLMRSQFNIEVPQGPSVFVDLPEDPEFKDYFQLISKLKAQGYDQKTVTFVSRQVLMIYPYIKAELRLEKEKWMRSKLIPRESVAEDETVEKTCSCSAKIFISLAIIFCVVFFSKLLIEND